MNASDFFSQIVQITPIQVKKNLKLDHSYKANYHYIIKGCYNDHCRHNQQLKDIHSEGFEAIQYCSHCKSINILYRDDIDSTDGWSTVEVYK